MCLYYTCVLKKKYSWDRHMYTVEITIFCEFQKGAVRLVATVLLTVVMKKHSIYSRVETQAWKLRRGYVQKVKHWVVKLYSVSMDNN